MESTVIVGVDLGQRVDNTAIVMVETEGRPTDRTWERPDYDPLRDRFEYVTEPELETIYLVRHLERVPLNTGYTPVADHLADLADQTIERRCQEIEEDDIREGVRFLERDRYRRQAESDLWFLIDVTGVGRPVVDDLIRPRMAHLSCPITAVTFRAGETSNVVPRIREATMGKAFMVSRLQALLQGQRIKLPNTEEARALMSELVDYEIKVSRDASMELGAKIGKHDDLATALGLATLLDPGQNRASIIPNPWFVTPSKKRRARR